jgi:DNA/RNA-binding domain of Phe-tRNA-synthetase-like protein
MDDESEGGLAGPRVSVAPEVFARHPDYRSAVVHARRVRNAPSDDRSRQLLRDAAEAARKRLAGQPVTSHPHIQAWRAAFAAFGAKPSRFRCSAEALLRRALADEVPPINRLVDAYNAVSIAQVIPVGGEDADRVVGDVTLRFAAGDELFEAREGGELVAVRVEPGEAIWHDAAGVTCRRWNWRQCARTALTERVANAYFELDALGACGDADLDAAVAALVDHLELLSPGCDLTVEVLRGPRRAAPESSAAPSPRRS